MVEWANKIIGSHNPADVTETTQTTDKGQVGKEAGGEEAAEGQTRERLRGGVDDAGTEGQAGNEAGSEV